MYFFPYVYVVTAQLPKTIIQIPLLIVDANIFKKLKASTEYTALSLSLISQLQTAPDEQKNKGRKGHLSVMD